MSKSARGPHRLRHVELTVGAQRKLKEFGQGDVILRHGTPCMLASVGDNGMVGPGMGMVWLCNLQTGSVWPVLADEEVWPCTDVELTFGSMRRG